MRIFQQEVFGPFTSVTRFADEADALRLANNSPFGLAAAIRLKVEINTREIDAYDPPLEVEFRVDNP